MLDWDIVGMLSFVGRVDWWVADQGGEFDVWLVVCFYGSIAFVSSSLHDMWLYLVIWVIGVFALLVLGG